MAFHPVIFVHGIQGSWLKDQYPVDYDRALLWSGILTKHFDSLHLHEHDPGVDADIRRWVAPHQAIPLIYESLVEEIRDEMDATPYAYVFTYDWRRDNRESAQRLADFVTQVLRVVRAHEKKAGRPVPRQVVLIGHSMGGLVIKWCATKLLAPVKIGKIITLATPFRGSLKAVEALLPGARNLFGFENKKSMRHAARTMPGVYQLLPSWEEAVVDRDSGKNLDIFDPATWQKNLVEGLAGRYFKGFLSARLADAKAFSTVVSKPWPEKLRRKVYYAYGVGSETWKQVGVDSSSGNFFLLHDAEADDEGDGTVHNLSSLQHEIQGRSHVYKDRKVAVLDSLVGQHANMPNHWELQDWILSVLRLNPYFEESFESPY